MHKYNDGKYICNLSPELQEKAKRELNEEPDRREEAIEILRQWLKKQPHINGRTDDAFLLKFLRGSKFSIERAKQKLETFYTMKTALPEWFAPINFSDPKYEKLLKLGVILPLGYDREGRMVSMGRMGKYNPSEYTLDDVFRLSSAIMDMWHWDEQTQICGSVFINDMSGMTGGHMAQMTPMMAKKAVTCWQDAFPMRIKGMHYWKTPSFFETVFAMIKMFMKDKLLRRVFIHGSNLESLHAVIPPEILPKEYGGSGGDVASIAEKVIEDLKNNQDFFFDDAKYRVDESKRPGKPKTHEDLFGVDGTFRKLNVD